MFFYAFAALAVAGAIVTVTHRNAVHSAIALIVSLLGIAGLFLLAQAEFLFAVQIVLYVGGVMVLFLFVIMLVNLDQALKARQFSRQWPAATVLCVFAGYGFVAIFRKSGAVLPPMAPPAEQGNTQWLAQVLFRQYLLPFELASVLLLVAMVGAVLMARKPNGARAAEAGARNGPPSAATDTNS
jgi:NADH-quinone oxidoreductase subunit J